MQRIPYTYRRGATYYWRRRFSAPFGTFELHLSLRVKEQKTARPLSSRLTTASEEVIDKLARGEMNKAEAERYMIAFIHEAASEPVRGLGAKTAQQREHAALCFGCPPRPQNRHLTYTILLAQFWLNLSAALRCHGFAFPGS